MGRNKYNNDPRKIGTVTKIDETGITILIENEKYGIISTDYLEQYGISQSDFRIGESFSVFPADKYKKGGKQTIEVDGKIALSLTHKSRSGRLQKSIKLERIKKQVLVDFESLNYDEKKDYLFDFIESLFWKDPIAYRTLCDFQINPRTHFDEEVLNLLILYYVLDENGSLTELTNEVLYEVQTGSPPYWLTNEQDNKNSDACEIIYFNEELKRKYENKNG